MLKAGIASVCGVALGNLGNAVAASAGLAALLAASSTAFAVVKLVGAAYLLFLGVKALRVMQEEKAAVQVKRVPHARIFADGFVVALLNPKTALFFAAFLPQFINASAPPLRQSLLLSCVFVLIAMCTDSVYVLTASWLAPAIQRRSRWKPFGRRLTAATFIGLGIYAALAGPRSVK